MTQRKVITKHTHETITTRRVPNPNPLGQRDVEPAASSSRFQSTSINQPVSSDREDPFSNISSIRVDGRPPSRLPSTSRLQVPSNRFGQNSSRLRPPSAHQPSSVSINSMQTSSRLRVPQINYRDPLPVASSTLLPQRTSGRQSQAVPSGSLRALQPVASSTLLPRGRPNQSVRNVVVTRPNVRSATITKRTGGGGKTTEDKKTVTKTMPRSAVAGPSGRPGAAGRLQLPLVGSPNVYVPPGHYAIPTRRGATVTQGGRPVVLSSPPDLRGLLDKKAPLAVQTFSNLPERGTYRDPGELRAHPAYQDMQSGMVDVRRRPPSQYRPLTREDDYFEPADDSVLNYNLDPFIDMGSDDEDDMCMAGSLTSFEEMIQERLKMSAIENPDVQLQVGGIKTKRVVPPIIITDYGSVQGTHQLNLEQTIKRLPEMELVNRHTTNIEADGVGGALEVEVDMQQMIPEGLNMTRAGETNIPLKEVISVTSSITIAPGVTSKYTKTVYERTVPLEKEELNEDQVQQLIDEENKDVYLMNTIPPLDLKGSGTELFDLKKRVQKAKLNPIHVKDLESAVARPKTPQDEPSQELHPELMAALMHSQEMGFGLDSEPANVCNYLFPQDKDVAEVEGAALPKTPVSGKESSESPKDYPTGDVYTAALLKKQTRPLSAKPAVRSPPREYPVFLENEDAPWQDDKAQPQTNVAGTTGPPLQTSIEAPEGESRDEMEFLEYELVPQPPKHMSRIQLRGSQKPPWFPGYYVALPRNIRVARSLTEVLPAAWKSVQPNIFAEDSIVVIG